MNIIRDFDYFSCCETPLIVVECIYLETHGHIYLYQANIIWFNKSFCNKVGIRRYLSKFLVGKYMTAYINPGKVLKSACNRCSDNEVFLLLLHLRKLGS